MSNKPLFLKKNATIGLAGTKNSYILDISKNKKY